jgi:hypothetical protein
MGESTEKASLRDQTGAIRHLDVVRARRLVQFFARPAVLDDGRLTWDERDSLAAATHGWLTLDHPAAAGGSAVVGHYNTHLYLHGLVRLPRRSRSTVAICFSASSSGCRVAWPCIWHGTAASCTCTA